MRMVALVGATRRTSSKTETSSGDEAIRASRPRIRSRSPAISTRSARRSSARSTAAPARSGTSGRTR